MTVKRKNQRRQKLSHHDEIAHGTGKERKGSRKMNYYYPQDRKQERGFYRADVVQRILIINNLCKGKQTLQRL